jgi:hypothetical protein
MMPKIILLLFHCWISDFRKNENNKTSPLFPSRFYFLKAQAYRSFTRRQMNVTLFKLLFMQLHTHVYIIGSTVQNNVPRITRCVFMAPSMIEDRYNIRHTQRHTYLFIHYTPTDRAIRKRICRKILICKLCMHFTLSTMYFSKYNFRIVKDGLTTVKISSHHGMAPP